MTRFSQRYWSSVREGLRVFDGARTVVGAPRVAAQLLLRSLATEHGVLWLLRLGIAACFIGHGAFGIITKADWLPYFAVAHIPAWLGWQLEPLIGTMDILIGLTVLIRPVRPLLVWGVFWGTWTALLRPLSGQGGWLPLPWEFVERAGNFGPSLALLCLVGWKQGGSSWWHSQIAARSVGAWSIQRVVWTLRITTASLLVGHGGFGAFLQKPAWTGYLNVLGLSPETIASSSLVPLVGWAEIFAGVLVLIWPTGALLILIAVWKLGTELLRLPAGEPIWEVVERGGSYFAPLSLFFVLQLVQRTNRLRQGVSGQQPIFGVSSLESAAPVQSAA